MHSIGVLALMLFTSAAFATQEHQPVDQKTNDLLTISGSVLRADTRAPLPHVQITVIGPGFGSQPGDDDESGQGARQSGTTTDQKGNFAIDNLRPGSYRLLASHAGMVLKGETDWGQVVLLQPGQSEKLTLLMLPAGAIIGRVLNEQGEPMQNVNVAAMHYIYTFRGRHLRAAQNATSDDKGEFRLFGLKPGSYIALAGTKESGEDSGLQTVTRPGDNKVSTMIYAPVFYPNETSPEQATAIIVKPGDEAQANFSLTRVPAHKISGKVAGLAPLKAKDAGQHFSYVTALRCGLELQSSMANVNKDSSFEIDAVTPGKYKLIAIDTDEKKSINYGFRDVVVDSSDVVGITIGLNSGKGQVSGIIRPESEAKLDLSRLYVAFVPSEPSRLSGSCGDISGEVEPGMGGGGYAKVEQNGSFKADVTLAPNPVYAVVQARTGGFEDWYISKVLLNGKDVLDSGFNLADAQRSRIEIVISAKGGTVEGTALDSENKPFPNAQILALPVDAKLRRRFDLLQQATADGQGHFKLRGVRPGEYIVMALEDAQEQPFTDTTFLKQNAGKMRTVKVGQSTEEIRLQTITAEE